MRFPLIATACLLAASSAYAADTPAQPGPQNAAVKSPGTNISNAPVKGANSFTRAEAVSHITARGYADVGQLTKDASGVWRGTASKDGHTVHVSLDYQGNVTTN